jgi:hypothetical protein
VDLGIPIMEFPTVKKRTKEKKKGKKRPVLVGIPIVHFPNKKNQAQVPKTKVNCHKPR